MDLDEYDPGQVRDFLALFGHTISQENDFPFEAIYDCLRQMMRIACYETDSVEAKVLREKGYNLKLGAALRYEMHTTLTQNFCVQAAREAGPESFAAMIKESDSYPEAVRKKPENFDVLEREYVHFLDNVDILYTCGLLLRNTETQPKCIAGGILDFGFMY